MDIALLYDISYGMYVTGANENGKLVGCITNTVVQVTNEPMTLAVCLNKDNYTYQVIAKTKKYSISILSEDTNPGVITSFGFRSSKDTDKYAGFDYSMVDELPVLNEKCCGTILCDVISVTDMGTHVIVFSNIVDTIPSEKLTPMTYSYYHKVIKGKAPKSAPTYQAEAPKDEDKSKAVSTVSYVCTVCGYVHEGDINEEPDDYACPICGVTKDNFVIK